ncbi:hypothetical protein [Nocardioides sp. SYSU D00038]|uniref:hypothetical protein n=1 Tax=Nocardioides sp. SYSU D00038 TaxID=2812554 RepID=UPI00196869D5|nr:hypothetical protein [Nocardioides sp. SYSU D00038]
MTPSVPRRRTVVLAAVAAVLAGGLGYLVGWVADAPTSLGGVAPVPATSPSVPAGRVEVSPDPADPPLAPGLPLRLDTVGSSFPVELQVPERWQRTTSDEVEWKWKPPGLPENTYFLRVGLVSSQRLTLAAAVQRRLDLLRADVDELVVEERTGDSLRITYVTGGHRRLALERWLSVDGSDAAQVTVAVIGREVDRAGLTDLMARISASTARAR